MKEKIQHPLTEGTFVRLVEWPENNVPSQRGTIIAVEPDRPDHYMYTIDILEEDREEDDIDGLTECGDEQVAEVLPKP